MQGAALTNDFMLGSATIMLGAQADLFNLMTEQSVGLVKNVSFTSKPTFADLTQGVQNSLVYSVMNGNTNSVSAEMYEYTPQNLAYGLSLDGSQIVRQTALTSVLTPLAAPAEGALTAAELDVVDTALFTAGAFVLVHIGKADNVMARKIVAVDAAAKSITFDSGFPVAVPAGAKVEKCNVLAVGAQSEPPFLSCKIVGTLANGETVPMLFPKVRVSSGLTMAFKTDNFDHIPFELQVFDLVADDPHYAMFQTIGPNGTPAKGMILD